MDGAVVRALASYRCSPGLIPGPGVTSEARLLSDLVRGFFSRSSGFLPPRIPISNLTLKQWTRRATRFSAIDQMLRKFYNEVITNSNPPNDLHSLNH